MKFYNYWRSTTSYRVRAALNLKRIAYENVSVDLLAGEQREADYADLNPAMGVPSLVLEDGTVLTQSMVILDWLDATFPDPRLIPVDPLDRARVLAAAHVVALDIHPVNNLRVIQRLRSEHEATPDQAREWMVYWMEQGFAALEAMLPDRRGFAFGDTPDIADLCILAQVYNARRWDVELSKYPKLTRIEAACQDVPEIARAHPDQHPDAKGAS